MDEEEINNRIEELKKFRVIQELKPILKEFGFKGISKLRKKELIYEIIKHEKNNPYPKELNEFDIFEIDKKIQKKLQDQKTELSFYFLDSILLLESLRAEDMICINENKKRDYLNLARKYIQLHPLKENEKKVCEYCKSKDIEETNEFIQCYSCFAIIEKYFTINESYDCKKRLAMRNKKTRKKLKNGECKICNDISYPKRDKEDFINCKSCHNSYYDWSSYFKKNIYMNGVTTTTKQPIINGRLY